MTWETRACCNGAALATGPAATKNKKIEHGAIGPPLKVFAKDLFIFRSLL
jgi:hypothetical protein